MNTHTPGPWSPHGLAVYTDAKLPHWISGRDARLRLIGMSVDHEGFDYEAVQFNAPGYDEAAANAALIAAAPELLAALEDVLGYGEDCAADRDERPGCLERARAAIAKAKGKQ